MFISVLCYDFGSGRDHELEVIQNMAVKNSGPVSVCFEHESELSAADEVIDTHDDELDSHLDTELCKLNLKKDTAG